uniref:Uncharacterized protein n=1 Tax=Myotis myotis TaxID=51298 RepID=A0A7J7WI84_MYOMY|nr:hypothetical protein mMyoMyo1_012137 [Myotis myotis]
MARLRLHPLSHTEKSQSARLGLHTLSCTEQGPSGGWGAPPCHAQSRADQGVEELPPVTHRAGQIRGLRRRTLSHSGQGRWGGYGSTRHTQNRARGGRLECRPLSPTEQGQSGGRGATTVTLRAGLMGRLWLYPVTHRAGPVGVEGLGRHTLSHTEP